MSKPRLVIACPRNVNTGGPEALHQLACEISKLGFDTFLWDPNATEFELLSHTYFQRYKVTWTNSPPEKNDIFIIPEVMGHLVPKFYGDCQCIFWWLSVDNFLSSGKIQASSLIKNFPKVIHASQSQYALNYLGGHGVEKIYMLTDYLNLEFIERSKEPRDEGANRNNFYDVAVNPAKGFERTSMILERIQDLKIARLENMSREMIIETLENSKIYLDLGNHPGKDRFP
jgi:hypothetical protein